MKIYKDQTPFDFLTNDSWEVDDDLASIIQDYGKIEDFNALAENTFPEGCTETELYDWLKDEQPILRMLELDDIDEEEESDDDED